MATVTIARLRELIRTLDYFVSTHAADELEDDDLTILDLESIFLTGRIRERQRDRKTNEAKFVVRGLTLEGEAAEAVCKLGPGGKLIAITVYRC